LPVVRRIRLATAAFGTLTVMQQRLAITSASRWRCVSIVWLDSNVDLLSLGHVLAVIETVVGAIHGIAVAVCGLSYGLFTAEQGFEWNGRRGDGRSSGKSGCADEFPPARLDGAMVFHEGPPEVNFKKGELELPARGTMACLCWAFYHNGGGR
jgi:hypothetical protein